MSTGKQDRNTYVLEEEEDALADSSKMEEQIEVRPAIAVPPRAREELKLLLRAQNEAQERVRLVLSTLEEALDVPAGWVIRDVDEGFVEIV